MKKTLMVIAAFLVMTGMVYGQNPISGGGGSSSGTATALSGTGCTVDGNWATVSASGATITCTGTLTIPAGGAFDASSLAAASFKIPVSATDVSVAGNISIDGNDLTYYSADGRHVVAKVDSPTLTTPNIGAATGTSLIATGVLLGLMKVIDMGTGATYALSAENARGSLLVQTDSDSATTVSLPDYTAAAAADKSAIGSSFCVLTLTAYATIIDPANDDKIRTNNGTLNGAGVSVTGPATVGAFSCYVLTDGASDVGHWTQFGINGAWPVTP